MRYFILSLFLLLSLCIQSQNPIAYRIYKNGGQETDFHELMREAGSCDVVFFGELHNNAVAHWLQLKLTKALFELKDSNLVLAAEMFESDNQLIINEYLQELISQKRFEKEARLWDNYKTDYKPILEFSKTHGLKLIASNIPRRYASIVAKGGFEKLEKLSSSAKEFIAPLPIEFDDELPGYQKMLSMGSMGHKIENMNMPKAQAVKDATMAYFINKNYRSGNLVLHLNGRYHSDNYEGIVWYLNKYNEALKVLTITTIEQDGDDLKNESGVADYTIVVDKDFTKTY